MTQRFVGLCVMWKSDWFYDMDLWNVVLLKNKWRIGVKSLKMTLVSFISVVWPRAFQSFHRNMNVQVLEQAGEVRDWCSHVDLVGLMEERDICPTGWDGDGVGRDGLSHGLSLDGDITTASELTMFSSSWQTQSHQVRLNFHYVISLMLIKRYKILVWSSSSFTQIRYWRLIPQTLNTHHLTANFIPSPSFHVPVKEPLLWKRQCVRTVRAGVLGN